MQFIALTTFPTIMKQLAWQIRRQYFKDALKQQSMKTLQDFEFVSSSVL